MKNGWKTVSLGEIATVGAGNSAPQDKSLFGNGTHPFIRTSDVGQVRFGSICGSADYLNNQGVNKLRRFEKGTILFPKSGASTFMNHRVIMEVDGYVASHLATIQAIDTVADSRFLLYYLSTIKAQDLIQDHKYPSLNLPVIKSIEVLLPSLPEQQRIVGILDAAFEGIATAKANAEKNLHNARALFESHLHAVFTQRGDGWLETTLGDSVHSISTGPFGSLLHKSDYEQGGIPLVNPINIEGGRIVPNERKAVGKETVKRLARYVLHEDDVVIGRRGEIGRCAVVTRDQAGWLCGTGCFVIRPSIKTDPHYLTHLLRSQPYREQLEGVSRRATMPSISNTDLSRLTIVLPPLSDQRHTLELIDSLSTETQRLATIYERKLAALDDLKKSLLHQAFSGNL